jgi:hypothetical protein
MTPNEININYVLMFVIFLGFIGVIYFLTVNILMRRRDDQRNVSNMVMHKGFEYEISLPGGKVALLTIRMKDLENIVQKEVVENKDQEKRITELEKEGKP